MEKDYFEGGKRTWKVNGRAKTLSKGQGEVEILSSGPTCQPGVIGLMMIKSNNLSTLTKLKYHKLYVFKI